jgi:hypothetical protein
MEPRTDTYSPLATAFGEKFGFEQVDKIVSAAVEHNNEIHSHIGSDIFVWALAIAVGYSCLEVTAFREYHGITVPVDDLRSWVLANGALDHFDGTPDFLGLILGAYDSRVSTSDLTNYNFKGHS